MNTLILGMIIGVSACLLPVGSVTNQTYAEITNITTNQTSPEIINITDPRSDGGTNITITEAFNEQMRIKGLEPENLSTEEREKRGALVDKVLRDMTEPLGTSQGSGPLQILSHSSFTDDAGYYHVVGEVKNNSPTTLSFVQVTGTFYDVNNKVVGTTFTYTNPNDIMAGGTAPFDLVLLSASVPMSEINTYKLSANAQ